MRTRCLASCLLLLLAPLAAKAGAPVVQWLPQESFPGGRLADARLDRPVRFWATAISLSDVFAGITRQTGVQVGFYPEGDENARFRVNLYLSPKQPPTLRDFLAQLAAARGEGLRWGGDFAPAVTDRERQRGFWTDRKEGDLIRLHEPAEEVAQARARLGPVGFLRFAITRGGETLYEQLLLLTPLLQPAPLQHLVDPPPG